MTSTILPTLKAFEALSLHERSLVFLNWVRNQPAADTYAPGDIRDCALCRFGRSLGVANCAANGRSIHAGGSSHYIDVIPRSPRNIIFAADANYSDPSTFGALAERLAAALRKTEGCNPS